MSSQARPLTSQFRGLYHRVAQRLGVDPSYVSRVARQERRSELISAELKKEVDHILLNSRTVLTQSISAQLDLALTFCKWARKARTNGDAENGCLACARQTSESAFRLMAKLQMEDEEYLPMRAKSDRLKSELQRLDQEQKLIGRNRPDRDEPETREHS
jgi:hypothetical protein